MNFSFCWVKFQVAGTLTSTYCQFLEEGHCLKYIFLTLNKKIDRFPWRCQSFNLAFLQYYKCVQLRYVKECSVKYGCLVIKQNTPIILFWQSSSGLKNSRMWLRSFDHFVLCMLCIHDECFLIGKIFFQKGHSDWLQ